MKAIVVVPTYNERDLPPINRSKFNVRFGLEKGGQDGKAEAHRRADHQ